MLEAENAAASAAGVDAWAFDFYLPNSIVGAEDPAPKHEALQAGLEAYLASSNKSLMKFWVTLIVNDLYGLSYPESDPWKYQDDFCQSVADLMADPQYLKPRQTGGKPVLGLFSSGQHGPALTAQRWADCTALMGGQSNVWVVQMSCSPGDAVTFDTQAQFCYGIQNLTAGQGHQPWTTIKTLDEGKWSLGPAIVAAINAEIDPRALDTAVTTRTFLDQPTQPQWYGHLRDGVGLTNSSMSLVFWDELAEEGGHVTPTVQEGTRFLDGVQWATKHVLPSTYTYELNLYSLAMTNVGTWTYVDPWQGVAGAHDNDEIHSSTTNDSKALTHPNMTECALRASKGPDRGIVGIEVDDVSVGTVDLYAASPVAPAIVWTSDPLSNASHKCEFIVTGTKNASSSSVKVQIDSIRVTYKPSG